MTCIATYKSNCPQKSPEEGWTLGPWVKVRFVNGGSEISVGNDSNPSNGNNAVIKAMDFGRGDTWTAKIIIQDQAGSELEVFLENMLRDARCLDRSSVRMELEFGWTKSGCNQPMPANKSDKYCLTLESLETAFDNGQFTFEITGRTIIDAMLDTRGDTIYGQDGDGSLPLKLAIQEMMRDTEVKPTLENVEFLKYEGGVAVPAKFKDSGDELGPKGKWPMNNRNKIDAARDWASNHRSIDDLGWKCSYQGEGCSSRLVFWEDTKPKCGESKDWDSNCLGFYIVNGGKDSPVIEFNPRFKWDFGSGPSQGGQAANQKPQMNDDGKTEGRWDCETLNRDAIPHFGSQTVITTNETQENINRDRAEEEAGKSQEKAIRAEKIFHDNIEADLVVIGDPTLVDPALAVWAFNVSIAFINPFYIRGKGEQDCGEWLAYPTCNKVLSNKAWVVKSLNHSIREGQYTTTLGLLLVTPGIDVDIGNPIGGLGSEGWVPPKSC